MSRPYKQSRKSIQKQDLQVQVEVTALGHKTFVGKILDSELSGKTIFLDQAIPGERYLVKVIENKKNYARGEVVEILEKSPKRIEPACKYYKKCGGCSLQHLSIAEQRLSKYELVKQSFLKRAKLEPRQGFEDLTMVGQGLAYRNRLRVHLGKDGRLGFYRSESRDFLAIDECLIAKTKINEQLINFPKLNSKQAQYIKDIEFVLSADLVWTVFYLNKPTAAKDLEEDFDNVLKKLAKWKFIYKDKTILISDLDSELSIGSFSQVNLEVNQALQEALSKNIEGDELLELYAGSGNFTFDLLEKHKTLNITAVESSQALVASAKKYSSDNNLNSRLNFVASKSEDYVRQNGFSKNLLLDPPRTGAKEVFENFESSKNKPEKIIYISCYLPTLIRDLETLVATGYNLEKVYVFDMFPQTYHVEMMVCLVF